MKVTLRCPPELRDRLPQPQAARRLLPEWLRRMPAGIDAEALGFAVRTVKQCPPFLDAMSAGFVIPLACDVWVEGGRFAWDWDLPASSLPEMTRAPMSFHTPEQATGAPFFDADTVIVKFNNFWTIALPEGWSLLVCHPFNRLDLPFRTLTGLVDADLYRDAFIQFPALWCDSAFEGVLPAGTPVAQCLPVQREATELTFETLTGDAATRCREALAALSAEPGVYRKRWRASKP